MFLNYYSTLKTGVKADINYYVIVYDNIWLHDLLSNCFDLTTCTQGTSSILTSVVYVYLDMF